MANRSGVTLVEVLVAALLLAIGVAGSLGAMLAAVQLRERASARESVAQALEARVAWFSAEGCAVASDTIVRARTTAEVSETWRLQRAGSLVRLEGRAMARSGPHAVRRALVAARRCD